MATRRTQSKSKSCILKVIQRQPVTTIQRVIIRSRTTNVSSSEGKFQHTMGYFEENVCYLLPEEAMYLLDEARMEIYYKGMPLSIQEAMGAILLPYISLEQYQVFSHFARIGYILKRYKKPTYADKININKYLEKSKWKGGGKRKTKDGDENNKDVTSEKKKKFSKDPGDMKGEEAAISCSVESLLPGNSAMIQEDVDKTRIPDTAVHANNSVQCDSTLVNHSGNVNMDGGDYTICNENSVIGNEMGVLKCERTEKLNEKKVGNSSNSCDNNITSGHLNKTGEYRDNAEKYSSSNNTNKCIETNQVSSTDNMNTTKIMNSSSENGNQAEKLQSSSGNPTDFVTSSCEKENESKGYKDIDYHSPLEYSRWDFVNDVQFPDISDTKRSDRSVKDEGIVKLCFKSPSLLPAGVNLGGRTEIVWKKNVNSRRGRPGLVFSYGAEGCRAKTRARNWGEYHAIMDSVTCDDDILMTSPVGHLWQGDVQPLVRPQDATSTGAILEKLKIIQNMTQADCKRSTDKEEKLPQIVYDGYEPSSKFKKTDPGLPHFRLVITSHDEPVPCLKTNHALHSESTAIDRVPLYWAVVESGDIAFYAMDPVDIPQHISLG